MSSAKNRKHAYSRVRGLNHGMELKQEFWDEFGLDLVMDGQGNVVFTQSGRDKYTPLFAKWGYCLANIRTVEDFKRILRRVNARELEENNQKLAACLADPSVPESEKDFIRKLLGPATPAPAARLSRSRQKPVVPAVGARPKGTAGIVLHVDFAARKVISRQR